MSLNTSLNTNTDITEIAHRLGRNTALLSAPEVARAHLAGFKIEARRVADNYHDLTKIVSRLSHVTHEIESIFDNFFVVEAAIFEIKNGMRARDFVKLPVTTVRTNIQVPRLYYILSELVKETNEVIDKATLDEFLHAYQEHSPLSIRELYAIPFILQVVLVEHFGQLIDQSINLMKEYESADRVYRSIKKDVEKNVSRNVTKKLPHDFSKITATLAEEYPLIPLSFGLYLFQRLSQEGSAFRPIIKWMKLNFEKQGMNVKDLGDIENRLRSESSTASSHIIESLHWLTQARWDAIVQEINVVDAVLSRDPASAYTKMDTESKSDYRRVIVRIAERAAVHEAEVARTAVRLAQNANTIKTQTANTARQHVGYYLVDAGRNELERKIGYRQSARDKIYRFARTNNEGVYFSAVISLNLLLTAVVVSFFAHYRAYFEVSVPVLFGAIVFIFFLNSEITLNAVNVAITRFLPIKKLPQLDLLKGIGANARTFVAVPSMFRSVESIERDIHKLEVRYLGNMQENIFYAILFDFKDAEHETMPEDETLVRATTEGIADLNRRYTDPSGIPRFYFLYRKRLWNESEGVYMCWERKRGKLREFNMLLRGDVGKNGEEKNIKTTTYINSEVLARVPHISYVITLDEDTELPKDSAAKLIGSISHPLNRYGIIQPQVSIKLATAGQSIFSKLFSSVSGIDSYSSAVSDVYQDLFDNGLFFGKGIYDIDIVEKMMKGKIPENLLLSHDMLEGLFVRVGLASSIVIFDDFPDFYHEYMVRFERWIRGDWQIIGWMRRVYKPKGATVATQGLAFIDRWKIFDNIRRSLIPIAVIVLIGIGAFSDMPLWHISIYAVIVFGAPFFASLANDIFSIKRIPIGIRLHDTFRQIIFTISHIILRIIFILDQAVVSLFAIIRTLVRLTMGWHLLQWKNSTDIGLAFRGRLSEYYRVMWPTQVISIALMASIYFGEVRDTFLYYWCVAWFISPIVGFIVSIPRNHTQKLDLPTTRMLRSIAYRTAHYFLDFSGAENNWLIQDHFQEYPKTADAGHPTTSPTNIGMLFASLFSAHEFGFIPLDGYIDRTRKAFESIAKLERFKGHLYNWYDIASLKPLLPKYVSSVDSANFIMALVAVRQGIQILPKRPIFDTSVVLAIEDALYTLGEEILKLIRNPDVHKTARRTFRNTYVDMTEIYKTVEGMAEHFTKNKNEFRVSELYDFLSKIHEQIGRIEKMIVELKTLALVSEFDLVYSYTNRLIALIEKHLGFMRYITPHAITIDHSIHSHIFRDEKLLASYKDFLSHIQKIPTFSGLSQLSENYEKGAEALTFKQMVRESHITPETQEYIIAWYDRVLSDMARGQSRAREFIIDIEHCDNECERFIDEPDFTFLYNSERGLFHIGYNAGFDKIDSACYNFLASEANSVSFVALLKNQVATRHWFYLGRKLIRSAGDTALVSWGGSLFEYLTPLLFFTTNPDSLLGKTARAAIRTHRKDAFRKRILWGMGESAYYDFDAGKNYQYQVFGSPRLGLKRGLGDYLVVAPYTTVMSLSIVPRAAAKNLELLAQVGAKGNYGFYDAIDYMNEERIRGSKPYPIQTYYAHHQGFSMLALHNAILGNGIRKYFKKDPRVESLDLLFEEKMPRTPAARPLSTPPHILPTAIPGITDTGVESKRYVPVYSDTPRWAFLSNGTYSVGITNSGAGWSRYKSISLTRYRDDPVIENYGSFIFIKNREILWSPTVQPANQSAKSVAIHGQKAVFYENKAEFFSSCGTVSSHLQVTIDPENPVEIRMLTLTNTGEVNEIMKVASYAEVTLSGQAQDIQHPQYQKLFVESEFLSEYNAIIYSRVHPEDRNKKIYFAHMITDDSPMATVLREDFIGRYGSLSNPIIFNLKKERHTQQTIPSYNLDPIYSLLCDVELSAHESTHISFINIAHENRDTVISLLKKYRRIRASRECVVYAEKESAIVTKRLGITQDAATMFQELASSTLVGKVNFTTKTGETIVPPPSGLPYIHSLWRLSISGDYPIVIIAIENIEDLVMVKYALACRFYWRHKGLDIDIVILNREPVSYIKVLDDEIDFLIRQSRSISSDNQRNSIYHVKSDLVTKEDRDVLMYVARACIDAKDGTFKKQVHALFTRPREKFPKTFSPQRRSAPHFDKSYSHGISSLSFENGWGGFDEDKSEYRMRISGTHMPPAPWSNIIANEHFGTVVTESGAMNTWAIDSFDNRITTWQNDPLLFKSSEIIYIRDEETGELWNPTPLPIVTDESFVVRHGKGYSIFEHTHAGIDHTMMVSVAQSDMVKFITLTMKNSTSRIRKLSVSGYFETVMGIYSDHTQDFISFTRDPETKALMCAQSFKNNLHGRRAFFDVNNGEFTISTDRNEFLGRNGSYASPTALSRIGLSNTIVHGGSACAVLQSIITLNPHEERTITFVIGEGGSDDEIAKLINKYRSTERVYIEYEKTTLYWKNLLSQVRIETPDKKLDIMFNNQLLYQTLSSRIWAKTGIYQPSGAYGFRDQLQDVTAFSWSDRARVRAFILKAAAHQFVEGDAENWWHDYNGFGSRNVLSDHQLWLVFAILEYVSVSDDEGFLDEIIPYLEGNAVNFNYNRTWTGTPTSTTSGTLYDHALRALEKSSALGPHGLPLMGMGDWNDGLSNVGIHGRGESVWVAWFLLYLIRRFTSHMEKRGDMVHINRYRTLADDIEKSLEKNAWDGAWYRRAFMDNGIALGSRKLKEFKIDSLAQSWAILASSSYASDDGGISHDKASRALHSAMEHLYDEKSMKLLAPSLQSPTFDPGYIKDYPPGVRENGAQYNHAALFMAQALFKNGEADLGKKILDLVNPIHHSDSADKARVYRVEPYVVASDIYTDPSYRGRGGWTWYTGSAGVMYKTILQYMIGFNVEGEYVSFTPSLPSDWKECALTYQYFSSTYRFEIEKSADKSTVKSAEKIKLIDDGKNHIVKISI